LVELANASEKYIIEKNSKTLDSYNFETFKELWKRIIHIHIIDDN
jgi:hypothetical protein